MESQTYSDVLLSAKRTIGDPPADTFINSVFNDPGQKAALQHWLKTSAGNTGIRDLAEAFPDVAFLDNTTTLPAWADRKLMASGSAFFSKHAEVVMSLLGLLSLPYCYAAANGAMVLFLSERMRTDTTKRLFETATFVWDVMAPDAFEKSGRGYTEIAKVRLMHAAVRYYTVGGGKWDSSFGMPINQEDMAGTNLSFSFIVIRGLRMLGYTVSQADQLAFLHLWNVIGYLLGLQEELIPPTPKSAQSLELAIRQRQFCVSAHGRELTKSLTEHIIAINKSKATPMDILGLMRYLLGNEVAEMLSINAPDLPLYKLSLIRTINVLKSLKPMGNAETNYRAAYSAFKAQKIG